MGYKKAIILFSGGLDSTTCLAWAQNQGFDCYALSFDYGQRHKSELNTACQLAKHYGVSQHIIAPLATDLFKSSSLVNRNKIIPEEDYNAHTIPSTYVPARHTIFLSMALAWAESIEAERIVMGVSAVDYSNYPDCRPEFINAFEHLIRVGTATENPIAIETPLLHLSKAQTVIMGTALGVDYSQTVSCYQANENGEACGKCDSCFLRKKGFEEAGIDDPTRYAS